MAGAQEVGHSGRVAVYTIPDTDMAAGSTLGGPKVTTILKASGAIEKIYSVDMGKTVFGTVVLRHYDAVSGAYLGHAHPGTFTIHPERQEYEYMLTNRVRVHEQVFVLSGPPGEDGAVDPPGVYQSVTLTNTGSEPVSVRTYAFADLRGDTEYDVVARYDRRARRFVAWNASSHDLARVFGCSERAAGYETSLDYARAVSQTCPGNLADNTDTQGDILGVLQHCHDLAPGEAVDFHYLFSLGTGRDAALKNYRACPSVEKALARTTGYYHDVLSRSVVLTPDPVVNRGVLWAKANMLRVENKAPTGWCFTNDPTRSNNSVGRDTCWFAFGADYLTPEFAKESLLHYVELQDRSGKVIEYYDIRTDRTEDYGLNINDNTPLLIMALWHHYNATGDIDFLRRVYPAAVKAGQYVLSQRNDAGLVWCTATGVSDWGIVGWRNVIPNYRLSGATTEVNSECFGALQTLSHMARAVEDHEQSAYFAEQAQALRRAINEHLLNHDNGMYYLNIDLDGRHRTDVTSDLVFPVMFGVADDVTAARIISRLSDRDFWTPAGIRTSPRDAPNYTPNGGWGLLGGVWVGVSFWYAFAAAAHSPEFMAYALSASFQNYSSDPRRNNTVPGQFSEWLHGETLVNEGMMLSPWFPPRYLWAAVEGVAGFSTTGGSVDLQPRLAPDWKWLAVQNLPYRGRRLTWFAALMPDLHLYTNFPLFSASQPYQALSEDITDQVTATGDSVSAVALRHDENIVLCLGSTAQETVTTAVRLNAPLEGSYGVRMYDSLLRGWQDWGLMPAHQLRQGLTLQIERKGCRILELNQER